MADIRYKDREVSLTQLLTLSAIKMQVSQITEIIPINSGADSRVYYSTGAAIFYIEVDETPAVIAAAAGTILSVTDTVAGTRYLNIGRFGIIVANGSGATFQYDRSGGTPFSVTVTDTPASLQNSINAMTASGSDIVTTGITAFAGGGQADATQLTYGFSEITTCATDADSVKLPVPVVGGKVTLLNDTAKIAAVFPSTGKTINDGAANASVNIAPGNEMVFEAITTTNWETTQQKISVPDGTVALPSISFSSDDDTGIYRIGANNIGVAANGAKVLDIGTTGLGITGLGSTTTSMAVGTSLTVGTDQTFAKEVNHTIAVADTTTAATVGGDLTLQAAGGATTGKGGTAYVFGGNAGTVDSGDILAATGRAPGGASGGVTIQTGTDSATGGSILLKPNETTAFTISSTGMLGAVGSVITLSDTTDSTDKDTGSIITEGGIGVEKAIVTGTSITAGTTLQVNSTTDSTTKDTGAIITEGGIGVEKAIVTGTSITAGTTLQVNSATDSTTKDTGSIITEGGVGVEKSIFAGLTINAGTSLSFGTVALGAAGAVGAPAYSFTGQTNQGMYSVSATQIGFSSGAGGLTTTVDASGLTSDSVRNRVNLGTTPVGTVSIVEYGDGKDITTVLTLTNFIVGALAGAAADLGIGNIVYAYPAGQHLELVYSLSSIVLTAAGTAVATDTGLGSVIASGVVNVLSGTATFEDRLTGQTINTAAGGGAAVSALTAATAGVAAGIALNIAASVKNVFLNSAGSWNADNTGNLTATGTIILKWSKMS